MKKIKIAVILLLVLLFKTNFAFSENEIEGKMHGDLVETIAIEETIKLNATHAILYDKTYQTVLYEKNAYERVPNASTTKMLTAIVAYENACSSEVVTISKNAATTRGSVINLRSGDTVTIDGLIKGLLIHSGNDAAVAIAEYIGGDVENFCEMMNAKAIEMGLHQTHFVTPHGLDQDNHYSTAYDLAKTAEYLLNIPYLAEIVCQKTVNIQVSTQTRIITTTNEMLSLYDGTNGVKTGFTEDAGRCLVTSCTRDNRTLIAVVLGCGTKSQRTEDSIKLLNYGYHEYEIVDICKNMEKEFSIKVAKGKEKGYMVKINTFQLFPIKKDKMDKINYQYYLKDSFWAPILEGERIGTIEVFLENQKIRTIQIILNETIPKKGFWEYFIELSR